MLAHPKFKICLPRNNRLFLLYFDYFYVKIINKYKHVVLYLYCILRNIIILIYVVGIIYNKTFIFFNFLHTYASYK